MEDLLNGVKTQNVDFTPTAISTQIKEMFQSAGVHIIKKTSGPKILEAVAENAKNLHGISGERILVELKKILSGDHGDLIYLIYNLNMALMYVYLLMKVWKNFAKSVKNAKSFLPKPRTLLTAI